MNWKKLLSDYGTLLVLVLLCIGFSAVTIEKQWPTDAPAAKALAKRAVGTHQSNSSAVILVRKGGEGEEFARQLQARLEESAVKIEDKVTGDPLAARKALVSVAEKVQKLDFIVADSHMASFCNDQLASIAEEHPALAETKVYTPPPKTWPNFLKQENLINILKQISVVAIIAIGMTLIIITTGIDLSVGSLLAFSGVVTALTIQNLAGDAQPTMTHLWMGAFVGILLCGMIGMFTGSLVTYMHVPAFIVTLGVMFICRGLSFILADSSPIPVANTNFNWLGRGESFGMPNSVILMIILYVLAHLMMTRTSPGRYIYAVGGNIEAARLSGVPIRRVLLFVYTLCGLLAGLGGVMEASLHVTGDPKAGNLVELQVIAAVVVGGTSLAGGSGKITGTLIGALIIGVIRNGMNLTGVEAHMQSVVYGIVILIAVLIDQLKARIK